MVSTRQMSNVGTSGEGGTGPEHGRVTRHSGAPPGSGSPNPTVTTVATYKPHLVPSPKPYSTTLMDMPTEIIEKIFSFMDFKNVAHSRLISRQMNIICGSILNKTFQRLQSKMLHRFHNIKAKMPRRESARRSHPLACESDIIETLHMRLSLLQMTFGKHIERKHCCFFPGEILDEVYSILSYLKNTIKLARPYKVTDELFDLTTMAMEYFKEHIEPNLPEITYFGTEFFDIGTFSPGESSKSYMCMDSPGRGDTSPRGGEEEARASGALAYLMDDSLPPSPPSPSPPPPQSNMVLRKRIHRIKQGMKKYNDQLSQLRCDLRSCKRKTAIQQKQVGEQQKQLAEQQKQTMEYANRLDDYDKKNEETSRKFQTLLQELNKCKTELQYWRSRSPAVPPVCAECGIPVQQPPALDVQWATAGEAELVAEPAASSASEEGEAAAAVPAVLVALQPAPAALAVPAGGGSNNGGTKRPLAAHEDAPGCSKRRASADPTASSSTSPATRRRAAPHRPRKLQ